MVSSSPVNLDIWTVRLDDPALCLDAHTRWLSNDELARAQRFVTPALRRSGILSRGILRRLLAAYTSLLPQDIRLACGPKGKPELEGRALTFNLSHSGSLLSCAVTQGMDVGIDIEQIRPLPDLEHLATRFFAPTEVAAILALPEPLRTTMFFSIWTKKEALLKATGEGLHTPLNSFSVEANPPPGWVISPFTPDPGYAGAFVYRAVATAGPAPSIQFFDHKSYKALAG